MTMLQYSDVLVLTNKVLWYYADNTPKMSTKLSKVFLIYRLHFLMTGYTPLTTDQV
jgi:hypothetical protein